MAAQSLLGRLAQLSAPMAAVNAEAGAVPGAILAPAPGVAPADFRQPQVNLAVEIERTREALIGSHTKMTMNLDPTWRGYLILPDAMYKDPRGLSVQGMQEVLNRYDRVAGDARYDKLVAMQEFQQVHELLGRYLVQMREMSAGPIALPPPPGK